MCVTANFFLISTSDFKWIWSTQKKIWGLNGVKWALHDKKNPFFWPKNFEIQNLPLIHLPIYKSIFFSGSKTQKCRFFRNKLDFYKGAFVSKKSTFLDFWPRKKIVLYIGKWINGKFWILDFLDEKSGFFWSWGAHFTSLKKFFLLKFFQTYPKA